MLKFTGALKICIIFQLCSACLAADIPAHTIPDVVPQTYRLLDRADGVPVVAATLNIGFYRKGATTGYLSHFIDLSSPSEARKTPEGLMCLLDLDLNRKDYAALGELHVPKVSAEVMEKQSAGGEPPNIVEQFRSKAQFGRYTYVGISLSPMPDLPVGNIVIDDPDGFSVVDKPQGFAMETFRLLSQDCEFLRPRDVNFKIDDRYTTINFDPPTEPTTAPATAPANAKLPGPSFRVHVLLQPVHEGPYQAFLNHILDVLKSGTDDDVRALFTADSKEDIDSMLLTANGREAFEKDRDCFRSGTPANVLLVDGDMRQYLIFEIRDSDRSVAANKDRLFIYQCCKEKNKTLLTFKMLETDCSLLVNYDNVPSDLCRLLVDEFNRRPSRDPAP